MGVVVGPSASPQMLLGPRKEQVRPGLVCRYSRSTNRLFWRCSRLAPRSHDRRRYLDHDGGSCTHDSPEASSPRSAPPTESTHAPPSRRSDQVAHIGTYALPGWLAPLCDESRGFGFTEHPVAFHVVQDAVTKRRCHRSCLETVWQRHLYDVIAIAALHPPAPR